MLLTFKTDTLSEIQYKNVLDIFDVSPWKTVVEISFDYVTCVLLINNQNQMTW